jgi:hypothetical protein
MARRVFTPKALVWCGLVVMATGIVTTILGQHIRHACLVQQGTVNGMDVAASVAHCSGYNVAAGAGYLILIVGAGIVLLAALSDTPRWRDKRLPAPTVHDEL